MVTIDDITKELSDFTSTETIQNQYQDTACLNNVRDYLEYTKYIKTRILLVAEAPGSKGSAMTGLPFTSIQTIQKVRHNLFREMKHQYKGINGTVTEPTGKIMWDYILGRFGPTEMPLIWNALPFHPHKHNGGQSPNAAEWQFAIDSKLVAELT